MNLEGHIRRQTEVLLNSYNINIILNQGINPPIHVGGITPLCLTLDFGSYTQTR
ncbi:MAG: hypothetical protein KAW66_14480 [Candidatus Lokiarchaeota archaeon]|nr:hypothetical protein [Candidatus Lokiarchaeota archaeon]